MTPASTPPVQVRIFSLLLRSGATPTPVIANAVGLSETGARHHLRSLKRQGVLSTKTLKGSPRGGRYSVWSVCEDAIGRAMRSHAKLSRDKGGMGQKPKLPKLPTDTMDLDVFARRMRIVETLKAHPGGITSQDLYGRHPEMNSGDTGWLRARGYFHTVRRPSKRDQVSEVVFYPGPKPEVTG